MRRVPGGQRERSAGFLAGRAGGCGRAGRGRLHFTVHPLNGVRGPREQPRLGDGCRGREAGWRESPGREALGGLDPRSDHSELHHPGRPEGPARAHRNQHPVKTFKGLKRYTTEQVIWRSAQTGKELASSSQFPKMTQGILVTPGYAGLQYFLTANGHIIALQVTPKH